MSSVQLFLSAVSVDFRSYRDTLRRALARPNVTVMVQEEFTASGSPTLDKLSCEPPLHSGMARATHSAAVSVAKLRMRLVTCVLRCGKIGPASLPLSFRCPMRDCVFISYSHRDERWLQRLQVYLAPLERQGRVRRWDDTLIAPGQRWAQEIEAALERTRVAILLVSAEFLASEFISSVELPRLLSAAENQGVRIIPVVLDHCNFDRQAELAHFQAIHSPATPLETLGEPEQKAVLAKLAAAVEDAFNDRADGPVATAAAPARLVGLPARNLLFQGREAVLQALTAALQRGGRAALSGLPGLGKTETLIEYAYRHRDTLRWIFWCRADGMQQLVHGFGEIAAALSLPEAGGADQPAAAQAALEALSAREGWLLILDAAEELDLVRPWLPSTSGGQVLLSSRSAAISGVAAVIELEPLEHDAAVALLLRRAGLASVAQQDQALQTAALEVAQATAGFPLALDQAGAYIEETGCTLQEYAVLWRESSQELLAERGQGSLRGGDSLWQAWSLSLQQLQSRSAAAAALLRLLAFCHGQALPESALADLGPHTGDSVLAAALSTGLGRNALLREALRLAFLRRDAATRRLGMHRMVQQFVLKVMTDDQRRSAQAQALAWLDAAFPEPRFVDWRACEALVPHALSVLAHWQEATPRMQGMDAAAARLSGEVGYYLAQRARYAEAQPLVERALVAASAESCPPQRRARTLLIDAYLLAALGCWEPARERLLAAEALLAGQPPALSRVQVLERLATVDIRRGDLNAAETWLMRAQDILQQASATHSAEAGQCAAHWGALYLRRGDPAAARAAYERAAALQREVLPPEHPAQAQSLNGLAVACTRLGEPVQAQASYEKALALHEAAYGPNHPHVADTLVNLGLLHWRRRDLPAARAAYERAATILQGCCGPVHTGLAKAQACLAEVAFEEGRLDDAQQLYAQAREARLRLLGPDHVDSARALAGLAEVAMARGDVAAARTAFQEALRVLRLRLGNAHSDVRSCEDDLQRLTPDTTSD